MFSDTFITHLLIICFEGLTQSENTLKLHWIQKKQVSFFVSTPNPCFMLNHNIWVCSHEWTLPLPVPLFLLSKFATLQMCAVERVPNFQWGWVGGVSMGGACHIHTSRSVSQLPQLCADMGYLCNLDISTNVIFLQPAVIVFVIMASRPLATSPTSEPIHQRKKTSLSSETKPEIFYDMLLRGVSMVESEPKFQWGLESLKF